MDQQDVFYVGTELQLDLLRGGNQGRLEEATLPLPNVIEENDPTYQDQVKVHPLRPRFCRLPQNEECDSNNRKKEETVKGFSHNSIMAEISQGSELFAVGLRGQSALEPAVPNPPGRGHLLNWLVPEPGRKP